MQTPVPAHQHYRYWKSQNPALQFYSGSELKGQKGENAYLNFILGDRKDERRQNDCRCRRKTRIATTAYFSMPGQISMILVLQNYYSCMKTEKNLHNQTGQTLDSTT